MFINKILENGNPECPLCHKEVIPDQGKTSGAVFGPKGAAIMHKLCIDEYNLLVQLGAI